MLPTRKSVRDLLESRLDRDVALSTGGYFAPSLQQRAAFAVYVDPRMATPAVVNCEHTLWVLAAAAMGRFPRGHDLAELEERAVSAATERQLEGLFHELTALLDPRGREELRLYATYSPGSVPPADVPAHAAVLGPRDDLQVAISAYGTGRLSLVAAPAPAPVVPAPRQPGWSRPSAPVV